MQVQQGTVLFAAFAPLTGIFRYYINFPPRFRALTVDRTNPTLPRLGDVTVIDDRARRMTLTAG